MHLPICLHLTLPALLPFSSSSSAPKDHKDAILIPRLKSLIIHANAKTTHHRVPAVPQLFCHGPPCAHHLVSSMRCVNLGAACNTDNGENIELA
jgi:store-operated calcium entry-associated regulatory factor